MPTKIFCDKNPNFTSNFWRELFCLQGTRFNFSSAYHPQTFRQTEVVNKTAEMYLRCFAGDKPKDWVKWLSWVEYLTIQAAILERERHRFRWATSTHSSFLHPVTARVDSVEQELLERDTLLQQVRFKLLQVQNRMKQVYDQDHKEMVFQPGDLVYVRLHPYRQHYVERRLNMKLAAKYYGPYRGIERVGE